MVLNRRLSSSSNGSPRSRFPADFKPILEDDPDDPQYYGSSIKSQKRSVYRKRLIFIVIGASVFLLLVVAASMNQQHVGRAMHSLSLKLDSVASNLYTDDVSHSTWMPFPKRYWLEIVNALSLITLSFFLTLVRFSNCT